ncbi:hypothetical protein [Bacillus salipaludis]|uniref:Lipoprotein n=1 Tax=Bacillus salipaludis TaxID=2547811 RepID=A0ABW8RCE4_9BACI
MLSILILSACNNASFKEENKATIKTVKTTFYEKAKKANKKSGEIQFYLPAGYEIKDESANNIILKNDSDTYILFINPQEDTSSDVVYHATVEQYKELDTNETFTKDNKFGFLTIKQLDENKTNELIIGVGGAKITAQIKTSDMNEDSKAMIQIANSVKYTKKTKE